jgi:hypothetical protein
MAGTKPKIRFSKVIEILLWLAGLGVLADSNITPETCAVQPWQL